MLLGVDGKFGRGVFGWIVGCGARFHFDEGERRPIVADDIDFTFDVYVNQGSGAGQGSPTAMLDLPGMPASTQFAASRERHHDLESARDGEPGTDEEREEQQ